MNPLAYAPGTVARIVLSNGVVHPVAIRLPLHEGGWASATAKYVHSVHVVDVRPLVVLDPEDDEQVERLAALLWPHYSDNRLAHLRKSEITADALRDLIRPPKPVEPTGLGAVVEDAEGFHWVRIGERDWYCEPRGNKFYHHINAVRVLSAGVTS